MQVISDRPFVVLLVGLPGVGKSTWISNHAQRWPRTVIVSSDQIIDQIGQTYGMTYNELFDQISYSFCEKICHKVAKHWISNQWNIVWDQINLTANSRKKKLKHFPDKYQKICVYFPIPPDHQQRLDNRRGKVILPEVIQSMKQLLEPPTIDEGFDQLLIVENDDVS